MNQHVRPYLFLLLLLSGLSPTWGQSKKEEKEPRQRVSGRFSTPSKPNESRPATATVVQPIGPTTGVAIMQRQTYLDGQQAPRYFRNQVDVNFHLLPTLTWNTVSGTGTYAQFSNPGASLRFSVGPNVDVYFVRNRYAVSTGLWYTVKSSGFIHPVSDAGGGLSTYNLQYLQLPITMKMVSDNLIKTGRTYLQYGLTADFKLAETPLDPANNLMNRRSGGANQFKSTDFNLLFAVGYMRRISPTNSIVISLQYQRGIGSTLINPDLSSKNNLLALGAGLSF